jgi:hypothetical protein
MSRLSDRYRWVEKKPGEWWHAQLVDGEPWLGPDPGPGGTLYPPDKFVSFPCGDDGKPLEYSCWHLYALYNGAMPPDPGEDCDYLHICGADHLADLIAELTALGEAMT